jgi:hypothetical protein
MPIASPKIDIDLFFEKLQKNIEDKGRNGLVKTLNETDENGNTILHALAYYSKSEDLEYLLSLLARVFNEQEEREYLLQTNFQKETVFHKAFGAGKKKSQRRIILKIPKDNEEQILGSAKILLGCFGNGEVADKIIGQQLHANNKNGESPIFNMLESGNNNLIKISLDSFGNGQEGKKQKSKLINHQFMSFKNLLGSQCIDGTGENIEAILDSFGDGNDADIKRIEYIKNAGDLEDNFEVENGDWAFYQAMHNHNNDSLNAILEGFGNSELGKQARVHYIMNNASMMKYEFRWLTDAHSDPQIIETVLIGLGGADNPDLIKEFFAKAQIEEPALFVSSYGTKECLNIVSKVFELSIPQKDDKNRINSSLVKEEDGSLSFTIENVDDNSTSLLSRADLAEQIYSRIDKFMRTQCDISAAAGNGVQIIESGSELKTCDTTITIGYSQ